MRIHGLDFTSVPSKRKPLVVVGWPLDGDILRIETTEVLGDLKSSSGS